MLWKYISTHRKSAIIQFIAHKCSRFIECYENGNSYNFELNGERFVLEVLSRKGISCIFDCGANIGDWALMAKTIIPAAEIHCFEIMKSTCEELKRRTKSTKTIIVNDFGLSDKVEEVKLKYFPEISALTTTLDYPHEFRFVYTTGNTTTGDIYMEKQGIKKIDFLKIDVEGVESRVLKGFAKALSSGRIDVIQFEYGKSSIITKFMLYDYYNFLTSLGYRLGKIYPNYVEFKDYNFTHEDFLGPNYLAVRNERKDLIDLLGCEKR